MFSQFLLIIPFSGQTRIVRAEWLQQNSDGAGVRKSRDGGKVFGGEVRGELGP